MRNKKIKQLIFSIVLGLIFFCPVFAATSYPMIGGITISESSTAADYIVYFFNLCVAAGSFIAVVIVIMAGIEWMMAGGNPSKIEDAKGKIKNTLLGVAILLGCYLILDTINPELKTVKINKLECSEGIMVTTKVNGKDADVCISDSTNNVGFEILSTKKWFLASNSIIRVFIYPETDFKGTPTPVNYGGNISGAKSIYFEWNKVGIYLYDKKNYDVLKGTPLFLSSSISNLADSGYDNTADSLRIIDTNNSIPLESVYNHAILFEDPNYRGKCSFIGSSVKDLSSPLGNYYKTPIYNDTLSSLIFFKTYGDQTKNATGKVTFYSDNNCGGRSCEVDIFSNPTPQPINCVNPSIPNSFKSGDNVMSFKITGSFGLVLMTGNADAGDSGKCEYWGLKDIERGTCEPKIIGEDVYTAITCGLTANIICDRPKYFMAFPVDE